MLLHLQNCDSGWWHKSNWCHLSHACVMRRERNTVLLRSIKRGNAAFNIMVSFMRDLFLS